MADGKLTYDIDFIAHTESITNDIARAVSKGLGYSRNPHPEMAASAIDAALLATAIGLGGKDDQGRPAGVGHTIMEKLSNRFGFNPEFSSVGYEASIAASAPYHYTPSTIQGAINSVVKRTARNADVSVPWSYNLSMQAAIRQLAGEQRFEDLTRVAQTYQAQSDTFAKAAIATTDPVARKQLLSLAANRLSSLTSRTLMESGAVTDKQATAAAEKVAELRGIRSQIKTEAQFAAAEESNRKAWLRDQVKSGNRALGIYASNQRAIEESWGTTAALWGAESKAEARAAAQKGAEEDAAWAAREKELSYSEAKKAREMEKGFRTMEAASATKHKYNMNADAAVTRWDYGASLYSAAQYAAEAEKAPEGSSARESYIALARESMRGVTISGMAKSGMNKDELVRNTTALLGLTKLLNKLSGTPQDGGPGFWSTLLGDGTGIVNLATRGVGIASEVMKARTTWLADTRTPYQTRRSARQQMAQNYGSEAMMAGAAAGAAIGTMIAPGIGTVAGGLIGAVPGAVSLLLGTHNENQKKIADAQMQRASDMTKYRALYGNGVSYNYAQMVEGTGYISQQGVLQMNQAADMLPGALAFGAVDERTMMALSYMPNYYAALLEGRSTEELMAAYRQDLMALPPQYRQYISSLLPGVTEDTRAFASSGVYEQVAQNTGTLRAYDATQYGYANGLMADLTEVSRRNVRDVHDNAVKELNNRTHASMVGDYDTYKDRVPGWVNNLAPWNKYAVAGLGSVLGFWNTDPAGTRATGPSPYGSYDPNAKLGDIIVIIDGQEIYKEGYSLSSYKQTNQSYVVGG